MSLVALAVVGAGALLNSFTPLPSTGPITVTPSATVTPTGSPTLDVGAIPGLILLDGSFATGRPVWLVKPDGTDLHRFAPRSQTIDLIALMVTGASWSIDGRQVVLTTERRDEQENRLFVANVDGSGLHAVSDADWANIPGGRPTYDATGERVFDGTRVPGTSWWSWSPDRRQIVSAGPFRMGSGQASRMYITDVADGAVRELPVPPELCLAEPTWSSGGGSILATSGRPPVTGGSCVGVAAGQHDLYVIRPDGTGLTQLTSDHDAAWGTWTPDGTHIVYWHAGGLWIMDPDGRNARVLAPTFADLSAIAGPNRPGDVAWGVHPLWQPQRQR
jgi:Tol biopolymer transport system component